MKTRRGITLIEVLVAIAIVIVVVAISFPVFARTKERGKETKSISNMRQIYVAIEVYRADYQGVPFGSMSAMGLPPWPNEAYLGASVKGLHPANQAAGASYYYYPASEDIDHRLPSWREYVLKHEGDTVLLADVSFNPKGPSGKYPRYNMNPFVEKYVIGIKLDGGIRRKRASGGLDLAWWDR